MIPAISDLRKPALLFALSMGVLGTGLLMRSCHAGPQLLAIPLCNGEDMLVATGRETLLHCAGCYMALAGALGMFLSLALKTRCFFKNAANIYLVNT